MVTTSNHALLILKSKEMCLLENDYSETHPCDESDGTWSGASASTESISAAISEKRRRRGAYQKPRPPRKKTPRAFS